MLKFVIDSEVEREIYRKNPEALVKHVKEIENAFNGRYDHNILGTPQQAAIMKSTAERMRELIKDNHLLRGMLHSLTRLLLLTN
jgi:hypothetical protein